MNALGSTTEHALGSTAERTGNLIYIFAPALVCAGKLTAEHALVSTYCRAHWSALQSALVSTGNLIYIFAPTLANTGALLNHVNKNYIYALASTGQHWAGTHWPALSFHKGYQWTEIDMNEKGKDIIQCRTSANSDIGSKTKTSDRRTDMALKLPESGWKMSPNLIYMYSTTYYKFGNMLDNENFKNLIEELIDSSKTRPVNAFDSRRI